MSKDLEGAEPLTALSKTYRIANSQNNPIKMTVDTLPSVARSIHQHLEKARNILIIPHQNPDGDAMGSATAFYEYLSVLGKTVTVFCVTPVNGKLEFLSHPPISSDPALFNEIEIDTIIVLDSGDLRYAGIEELVRDHPATIINIDHHSTNPNYGHLNLVIPTAASTTEVLFRFFRHNGIPITQKMATALLAGLSTDTMNFTNSAASQSAFAAGGELILIGGNYNLITANTLKNKSVETLRLWGRAFNRLQKNGLQLTSTYVTQSDFMELGVGESEYEGISNFLSSLENTDITLVLLETPEGRIKGSFRTTKDNIDVSQLAKKIGGGGHKKAAGFSSEGTVDEVLQKVLTLL